MTDQDIIQLFRQFDAGDPAATEAFLQWSNQCSLEEFTRILELAFPNQQQSSRKEASPQQWQQLQQALMAVEDQEAAVEYGMIRRMQLTRRWVAAAGILLVLAAGIYFWSRPVEQPEIAALPAMQHIVPGSNGAVLTLNNGTQVVLDSLANGIITTQNGANVMLQNGQLAYEHNGTGNNTPSFNTIATPKGRQFQLLLPDGTIVYLNAASSLRYPTFFTGKERRVQVTGEAYFEVAANASMPFKVETADNTTIEVLGTAFNVNAYDNEHNLNATLVAGAVRVSRGTANVVLQPGQQAMIEPGAVKEIAVRHADVEKVTAWRKGIFDFNELGLREMMRQLERWYDIEVIYEGNVPDVKFFGKISRSVSLTTVLEALDGFGLHYRVEGRKIIVTP